MMEAKKVKIEGYIPGGVINRYKERLIAAFENAKNFDDVSPEDQFLMLGHIKILCAFCAEDMIRAQMMTVWKEITPNVPYKEE